MPQIINHRRRRPCSHVPPAITPFLCSFSLLPCYVFSLQSTPVPLSSSPLLCSMSPVTPCHCQAGCCFSALLFPDCSTEFHRADHFFIFETLFSPDLLKHLFSGTSSSFLASLTRSSFFFVFPYVRAPGTQAVDFFSPFSTHTHSVQVHIQPHGSKYCGSQFRIMTAAGANPQITENK